MAHLLRISLIKPVRQMSVSSWRCIIPNCHTQKLLTTTSPNELNHWEKRSNCTQVSMKEWDIVNNDANIPLQKQFNYIEMAIKERQKVSKRAIDGLIAVLRRYDEPLDTRHVLIAIRSCGYCLYTCMNEERMEYLNKIWDLIRTKNITLNIFHFNALLRTYVENEYYDFSIIKFMQDIEESNIQPNKITYQYLIHCLCQKGETNVAVQLLDLMRQQNISLNPCIFDSLIKGYSQSGNIDDAFGILEVMKKSNVEMSEETYAAVMTAYAYKGDISNIIETMKTCNAEKLSIPSHKFLEVICALLRNKNKAGAQKLLLFFPEQRICRMDDIKVILKILEATQSEEILYQILDRFVEVPIPVITNFIQLLVTSKVPSELVIKICNHCKKWAPDPFKVALQKSFLRIDGYFTSNLIKEWKNMGAEIRSHYFFPAIVNHAKNNNAQGILDTLNMMKNHFDVEPCIITVANYVLPFGIPIRYSLMEVHAKLKESGVSKIVIDNAIVANLLDHCMLRRAAKYMTDSSGKYSDEIISVRLVKGVIRSGDVNSFLQIFLKLHEQRELFKGNKTIIENGVILSKVSGEDYLYELWNRRKAYSANILFQVWKFMTSLDLNISKKTSDLVLSHLQESLDPADLEVLNKTQQINITSKLIESIEEADEGNNSLKAKHLRSQLIHQFIDEKDLKKLCKTLKIFKKENASYELSTCNQIINFFCDEMCLNEAMEYMNGIIKAGRPILSNLAFVNYAVLLVKNNKIDEAMVFLTKTNLLRVLKPYATLKGFLVSVAMTQSADEIIRLHSSIIKNYNLYNDKAFIVSLLQNFINRNDLKGAVKIYIKIIENKDKLLYWDVIVQPLILAKDVEILQTVVDRMNLIFGEWTVMIHLMFSFLKCNKLKQAKRLLKTPGMTEHINYIYKIIDDLIKAEDTEILERFIDISMQMKLRKEHIYDALLELHAKTNDWKRGVKLWTKIQEEDIIPSHDFLQNIAKLLALANDPNIKTESDRKENS